MNLPIAEKKTDQWPQENHDGFHCREHARWAIVFRFLKIDYAYQREHFGLTAEYGFTPDFNLHDSCYFHCCNGKPSGQTKISASMVAQKTGMPVAIAQGEMFIPNYRDTSIMLWYTTGEGVSLIRYLCMNGKAACFKRPLIVQDCVTPRLCEAFRRALAKWPTSQE